MNLFDNAIGKVKTMYDKVNTKFEQMRINNKGEMSPKKIINSAISVILVSAAIPSAITILFNMNTSTWNTGAAILWNVLPLIIIAAIVLTYYSSEKDV